MKYLFPLLLACSFSASADIRIWRTATNTDGNLGGRAGADSFCDSDANKPAVASSQTRAFISVEPADEIRDMASLYNIPTNEAIFRLDGTTQIAANFTALLNSNSTALTNSINGIANEAGAAFTGSTVSGALDADNCSAWSSSGGAFNGMSGLGDSVNGGYLNTGVTNCSIGNLIGLFCITYTSSVVPAPAPRVNTLPTKW